MPVQRIVVIGGVAAGPAAAAEARRTDPGAEVVLYEEGAYISYGACEMPYYVAGWIEDPRRLIVLTPEELERTRGVKACVRHRVRSVEPQRGQVVVEDLERGEVRAERFDKIILATGARAIRPGFEGADASNVFALRRLEDAYALRSHLEHHAVRHAVVLGGGYVGVEVTEALRSVGARVSILQPGGRLLRSHIDEDLCVPVDEVARRHGVIVRDETAVGFECDARGFVSVVRTDRGERIGCDLVVAAMGVVPDTALAPGAGVRAGRTGALAVDEGMRTNVPNVWACGDVVEVTRVIDGARIHLPLAPVAFRTAHVAGCNAARRGRGSPARFPGVCVSAAVKFFEVEVATVGLRLAEAHAAGFDAFAVTRAHWSRARKYPRARRIYVRLVASRPDGRLLGATLVGEEGCVHRADVLVPLVREGWTAAALRDLDLIYAPPFAPSIDPLIAAAHEVVTTLEKERRGGKRAPRQA